MKRFLLYYAVSCLAIPVTGNATAIVNLADLTVTVQCGIPGNSTNPSQPCPTIGSNGAITLTQVTFQPTTFTYQSGNGMATASTNSSNLGTTGISVTTTGSDTAFASPQYPYGGIAISKGLRGGQITMSNNTNATVTVPIYITASWTYNISTNFPNEAASLNFGFDVFGYSQTFDGTVLTNYESLIPDFTKRVGVQCTNQCSIGNQLTQVTESTLSMPLAPNGTPSNGVPNDSVFYIQIDPQFIGVATAPEPDSMALLVIGLAGLRLFAVSRPVHKKEARKIKQAL